jgi:PHD/YefM family antitoxin component YafN of YafNO toxin-antitoxin module
MTTQMQPMAHVDEPHEAKDYADVISRVAAEGQAVIVRRNGADLAAIVPLEYLELLQDALQVEEAQRMLKTVNWERKLKENPPPQSWFDGDEPKPF